VKHQTTLVKPNKSSKGERKEERKELREK